jgi:hypothetical protein
MMTIGNLLPSSLYLVSALALGVSVGSLRRVAAP